MLDRMVTGYSLKMMFHPLGHVHVGRTNQCRTAEIEPSFVDVAANEMRQQTSTNVSTTS